MLQCKEETWTIAFDRFHPLTLKDLAAQLERAFEHLGIPCPASSSLGGCITATKNLAPQGLGESLVGLSQAEILEALASVRTCQRIAQGFKSFERDPGLQRKLRPLLKDDILPGRGSRSRSRNIAFELYVGSTLKMGYWKVEIGEPDFICASPALGKPRVLVACKQIESPASLGKALRRAKTQICRQTKLIRGSIGGLVAVDFSTVFDHDHFPLSAFPDEKQISRFLSDALADFVGKNERQFWFLHWKGVLGILACATVFTLIRSGERVMPVTASQMNLVPFVPSDSPEHALIHDLVLNRRRPATQAVVAN